jgi:NifU-like protein involved in Fe-S cluster formation
MKTPRQKRENYIEKKAKHLLIKPKYKNNANDAKRLYINGDITQSKLVDLLFQLNGHGNTAKKAVRIINEYKNKEANEILNAGAEYSKAIEKKKEEHKLKSYHLTFSVHYQAGYKTGKGHLGMNKH